MSGPGDLHSKLSTIAERLPTIRSVCTNEESTKLFLVLPVLGALGYDVTDPKVVQPEFAADIRGGLAERVDYAILRDGIPIIAVECKKVGVELAVNRGQLRAYFTALPSVKLGILTNGLRFEFFVDVENANIMDEEPFVTLDMETVTQKGVPPDVVEALCALTSAQYHPSAVMEIAEMRLVSRRLRTVLMREVREPSLDFCRVVLRLAGLESLRRSRIEAIYSSMVRRAFEEAFVLPVLELLRTAHSGTDGPAPTTDVAAQRIVTTDRELAVYRYVCRRLAFLADDEHQFSAIEHVHYRDYVGKFAVYYRSINKGRLFDFIEGGNGYDKFIFPEPFGEIMTSTMSEIDEPLRVIFSRRIRELGSAAPEIFSTVQKLRA
jgi:predicted type IV restriction endonuclease